MVRERPNSTGKVAYSGVTLTSSPTAGCNPNIHNTRGHPQLSAATTVGSSGRHSPSQKITTHNRVSSIESSRMLASWALQPARSKVTAACAT